LATGIAKIITRPVINTAKFCLNPKQGSINAITSLANSYTRNPGHFLTYTAAFNFAFLSFLQSIVFFFNQGIPEKDRKFLAAQEFSEGLINVLIFSGISGFFRKIGESLVEKGIFVPKEIKNKIPLKDNKRLNLLNIPLSGMKIFNKESKKYEIIIPKFDNWQHNKTFTQDEFEKILRCGKGVGVISAIVGSVIALNIFTPICRNLVASWFQKFSQKNNQNLFESKSFSNVNLNLFREFLPERAASIKLGKVGDDKITGFKARQLKTQG